LDYVITAAPPSSIFAHSPPPSLPQCAVVRLFGVTSSGNSVCVHVHGFQPYFYASLPPGLSPDDLESFRKALNDRTGDATSGRGKQPVYITRVEVVKKQSLWGYQRESSRPFLKITCALPNNVTTARGVLEKGLYVPNLAGGPYSLPTFESNVLFVLRFMVDCHITGGNWLTLPPGAWAERTATKKVSTCQLEVDVLYDKLVSHTPEPPHSALSKFRILSMDIECAGRKGHFPDAKQDPVIQIASFVTVHGDRKPAVKCVMTLGGCASIVGAEVMSFDDEKAMLRAWRDFVIATDPDWLIGYNVINFDFPYLIDRAAALGVTDFPFWGRIRGSRLRMRDATFSSKAYGTRESKEITIEGRVQFDLLQAIQRDHKLSSYSLNSVSARFLGEQKEDVHHSAIADLFAGSDESRRRLAVYCLKDAYLPQRLLEKLMMTYNYIEMARVTGVPISFLLARGQSIKVLSQILRKAQQRGLLVPNLPRMAGAGGGGGAGGGDGVAYEGATVLDAKVGFYEEPIATLDFASLYPSIMMAHNLCYCTLVQKAQAAAFSPEDVTRSPSGDTFVKPHLARGILPEILEELLSARKRAKADIKKATDPFEKAVLDGRQLALKVSANSVYGFTGAIVGKLPCLEISASVTAYGRGMIEHTKQMVHSRFSVANGYAADAEVIYGDTDSVMVNFHAPNVGEAMRLGREAAEHVSATFARPISLEFEKVYFPYLLISKKRYAGLYWTRPEIHDKMDTKGIETVRRDNCLLVRQVVETCLHKILVQRDVPGAVEYVKQVIGDLLMNRMDMSLLVITKGLTQEVEDYDNRAAHVELARKMRVRDPATAPAVGDRIPYVIVKAAKGVKAYEKSEDPIFALENNLPIDCQHYLEHYLAKPLMRLFEPILKNAERELLQGDHTRSISQPTPTAAGGGIMRFAKVRLSCVGCRAPMDADGPSRALCGHCLAKEGDVYRRSLATVNELQEAFSKLWTQCQRCQGSLHTDVLCTSRDCPIFYRRKKVQKDLHEATAMLERFEW